MTLLESGSEHVALPDANDKFQPKTPVVRTAGVYFLSIMDHDHYSGGANRFVDCGLPRSPSWAARRTTAARFCVAALLLFAVLALANKRPFNCSSGSEDEHPCKTEQASFSNMDEECHCFGDISNSSVISEQPRQVPPCPV